MSLKLKHAAQAWAFAVIFLLYDFSTLVGPYGERRMVSPVSLAPVALAHLAQILFIALLYGGLVALLRSRPSWRITQWIVFGITPLLLAIRIRLFFPSLPHSRFHARWVMLAAILLILVFAVKKFPGQIVRLKTVASSVFAGLAIFAAIISGELLRVALWHPGPHEFSHSTVSAEDPGRPRLVWIMLDELGYYQTFGDRDASLHLPTLDGVRAQSTMFTDVSPVRWMTIEAVPSMLKGSVVTKTRYTWDNHMANELEGSKGWHAFDPEDTLFGDAHRAGLRIALTGWQIPYCTIFESIADQCYATNWDPSFDGAPVSPQDGFLFDFWEPLRSIFVGFFDGPAAKRRLSLSVRLDHQKSVDDLKAHALESVQNSHADVIYLHMPGPHPPGAKSRFTHQLAADASYIDGLAQADEVLGEILRTLEAQPRWKNTTLIVQGDHGWRDWSGWFSFTPEDRKFWNAHRPDAHPLVLIHRPGQTSPETVSTPVNVLGIHNVVLSTLQQMQNGRAASSR